MSGPHRDDFPEGADERGHDPSRPVFGPANDGSADWFGTRDGGSVPSGSPSGPSGETPEWFTPRQSGERPVYGSGGFGGTPTTGPGEADGDQPGTYRPGAYQPDTSRAGEYRAGVYEVDGYRLRSGSAYGGERSAASRQGPSSSESSSSLPGGGYSAYDSLGSSGGSGGGRGQGGGGGGGSGGGTGGYEYGRRRPRRSASALIGPMAGAVGLAVLLGVGVYAFAESGSACTGDNTMSLTVAAAPDIAPVVEKAAERFNNGRHNVDGKCVTATVKKVEPSAVSTLLSGQGVANPSNERPDVWIPDSSLWLSLARSSDGSGDKGGVTATGTSVALSPVVVGLPRTLAAGLRQRGITAAPTWESLLQAAGADAGGAVTKNQVIPAGTVRLVMPDPTKNAAGMGALMITSTLLANDPNRNSIFTGIVRTVRESTVPTVDAEFTQFRKGRGGKQPITLSSEQALWKYNQTGPEEPAVALYPLEGTLPLDYPFTVTSEDAGKREGARLLEKAMTTEATRGDVRQQGFRTTDGRAPTGFTDRSGVDPAPPRRLPPPKDPDVARIMQAWSKLTLGLRILSLIDVSGSMAEQVAPNVNRLQAIAQVSQGGLSMMSNDTEVGQWLFSTNMNGETPYKEVVPMGPLSDRVGSTTRRGLVLSTLNQMRPKPNGDTGLYRTMLAAYKMMNETYKPEFGNSILLLTDGKNDDPGGPSLPATLKQLRDMQDPNKPIQVNMIGFGGGVDRDELDQIARATNGSVQVAMTPGEIKKIFLQMLSRRIQ
ncbi:VWA domain-containing protein [Actinomadura spongiicola]|uniref:VWA domain-containing protein n=1 Tax=Actinomadura spongiicola TaxID=2303421 RepID=A0A372GCG7_9ACTN|nr:substrate-binding and VWA domain-containing protein [Actinomadura spongiicola]RFS83061.1 VWA domain-containing protein [Actinomadura spongiicola]